MFCKQKYSFSFFLLFIVLLISGNVLSKTETLDRIAATVNDTVITQSEVNEAKQRIIKQFSLSHTKLPSNEVLNKRVLDQLIDRTIQLQIAEQAGVKISEEEVDQVIKNIAEQNKISVNVLYKKLASEGLTVTDYRKEIHDELILQKIQQQEVGAHISITPQEVNDFIHSASWKEFNSKEYHLEDLVITLPDTPTSQDVTEAKQMAETVYKKIKEGVSFQTVLSENSSSHNIQSGDLGWLKLPQIPPAFANELVHMNKNEFLGPIASSNGFHIIHLIDMRKVDVTGDNAEMKKQVEQLIYQRKMEEGLQSWLQKIRSEAFINLHPEN